MYYLPEITHILLAILAGLLFINQLSLSRENDITQSMLTDTLTAISDIGEANMLDLKSMAAANVAGIESMTDTTSQVMGRLSRRIDDVQDAPQRVEKLANTVMRTLDRVNRIESRAAAIVEETVERATQRASTEAIATARQLVENMILGKSAGMTARMERVEHACAPLPRMTDFRTERSKAQMLTVGEVQAMKETRERNGDDALRARIRSSFQPGGLIGDSKPASSTSGESS